MPDRVARAAGVHAARPKKATENHRLAIRPPCLATAAPNLASHAGLTASRLNFVPSLT